MNIYSCIMIQSPRKSPLISFILKTQYVSNHKTHVHPPLWIYARNFTPVSISEWLSRYIFNIDEVITDISLSTNTSSITKIIAPIKLVLMTRILVDGFRCKKSWKPSCAQLASSPIIGPSFQLNNMHISFLEARRDGSTGRVTKIHHFLFAIRSIKCKGLASLSA